MKIASALLIASISSVTLAQAPNPITELSHAWVRLYDDNNLRDNVLTVRHATEIPNLKKVTWDNGEKHPGDRITSVQYQIPVGWRLVLYQHDGFEGYRFPLEGTGRVVENAHLGPFSDRASSLRWERSN